MQQLEPPVDYLALHRCESCDAKHRLMAYPVKDGWVAATVCDCREKGLPKRYGTESEPMPTLDAAEDCIHHLLNPPRPLPKPDRKNLYFRPDSNRWVAQIERKGRSFRKSYQTEAEAREARDEFLREELEAA